LAAENARKLSSALPPPSPELARAVLALAREFLESAGAHSLSGLALGPYRVRLRCDDAALEALLLARFVHILDPVPEEPELDILVRRAAAALEALPQEFLGKVQERLGVVSAFAAGPFRADLHLDPEGRIVLVTVLDLVRRRAVYLAADDQAALRTEGDRPLSSILRWWAPGSGALIVHAAAVGHERAGALIVGRSGSGKSSVSLSVCSSRVKFLADDQTLLSPGRRLSSLYASVRVRQDMRLRLEQDAPWLQAAWRPWSDGVMTTLSGEALCRLGRGAPLSAIVTLRHNQSAKPKFHPIPTSAALRELAPSTLAPMFYNVMARFDMLRDLIAGTPAFAFFTGSHPSVMREVFADFLDRLST
jgi:hypothetical protein